LAFDKDEDERERRRKSRKPPSSPGVGNALRDAYQAALREDIPPEMLDLLGKLG
jgi:hypothetical protein